jgi:hypothetical protein
LDEHGFSATTVIALLFSHIQIHSLDLHMYHRFHRDWSYIHQHLEKRNEQVDCMISHYYNSSDIPTNFTLLSNITGKTLTFKSIHLICTCTTVFTGIGVTFISIWKKGMNKWTA